MKWRVSERSLFSVLMRSSWWISVAIALGVMLLALALLPATFRLGGALMSLPFFVIGAVTASRQWRIPSAGQVERLEQRLGEMAWPEFSGHLEDAFKREGYAVTKRGSREPVDFELERQGRVTLVCARRWKSAHTGVDMLRALHQAQESQDAQRTLYVGLGELTGSAQAFAHEHRIEVWQGAQLAARMRSLR
jgi:restriction system protein